MFIKFCKSTIRKVCVAFKKVFQAFMNVPSYLHHSWLFLIYDVMNFTPIKRKFVWSFMKRIKKSSHMLISNSYSMLMASVVQRYWNKLLRL